MSRPRRIDHPGATYHVTSRCKDGDTLFRDAEDRGVFINQLANVVERYGWRLHTFVLMDTHYHLVVELTQANLSRGMRQLNGLYTIHVKNRHGKSGSVFNGRFKSLMIEKKRYLLPVCRHVVTNPARVKPAKPLSRYPWSSYPSLAGLSPLPPYLYPDDLLKQFSAPGKTKASQQSSHSSGRKEGSGHGNEPRVRKFTKTAHKKYRDYIDAGKDAPSPLDERASQVLLGSPRFLNNMKPALQGELPLTSAQGGSQGGRRPPKKVVRKPSLKTLFKQLGKMNRQQRNEVIKHAHINHDYTLMEIGNHLDLHYTTVSKVVNS